jgi:serine/threonine-protein kinase RCK2
VSEPAFGAGAAAPSVFDAYSNAQLDGHIRAAQAVHVAAHHAEPKQEVHATKSKRVVEGNIAKLVAEENENKSKFPKYPGLERWELLEKMGDGAFSNVYRARDLQGQAGEVAIKVVRKYEMNNLQVSS